MFNQGIQNQRWVARKCFLHLVPGQSSLYVSTKKLRDVKRENSNIEYPSKIFVVFGLNLALII